ncbi:MAG: hypothetical protein MUF75_05475 [Bacteroidia bacterium]|jgi:hypothetical protein|nr:hypothetical protein [Bacteroidia bacterium]
MNWTNSSISLPKDHNRIVLLYLEGGYQIGKFDKYKKGFVLQNGNFIPVENANLHWLELSPPKN